MRNGNERGDEREDARNRSSGEVRLVAFYEGRPWRIEYPTHFDEPFLWLGMREQKSRDGKFFTKDFRIGLGDLKALKESVFEKEILSFSPESGVFIAIRDPRDRNAPVQIVFTFVRPHVTYRMLLPEVNGALWIMDGFMKLRGGEAVKGSRPSAPPPEEQIGQPPAGDEAHGAPKPPVDDTGEEISGSEAESTHVMPVPDGSENPLEPEKTKDMQKEQGGQENRV